MLLAWLVELLVLSIRRPTTLHRIVWAVIASVALASAVAYFLVPTSAEVRADTARPDLAAALAGRETYEVRDKTGTPHTFVRCPPPVARLRGTDDPLCNRTLDAHLLGIGVAVTLAGAVVIRMAVPRSRRVERAPDELTIPQILLPMFLRVDSAAISVSAVYGERELARQAKYDARFRSLVFSLIRPTRRQRLVWILGASLVLACVTALVLLPVHADLPDRPLRTREKEALVRRSTVITRVGGREQAKVACGSPASRLSNTDDPLCSRTLDQHLQPIVSLAVALLVFIVRMMIPSRRRKTTDARA